MKNILIIFILTIMLLINLNCKHHPEDTYKHCWALHTINIDGTDKKQITEFVDNQLNKDSYASISPSGTKVLFTSPRSGVSAIYIADINGSNVKLLSNGLRGKFSPDGNMIVFIGLDSFYYTMKIDGTDIKKISSYQGNEMSWSSDSTKIIYTGRINGVYNIFIVNSDGSNEKQITSTLYENNNPLFIPNSTKIIYTRFFGQDLRNTEIFINNIEGNNEERITFNSATEQSLTITKDGKFIFFTSRTGSNSSSNDIYKMNLETREITRITYIGECNKAILNDDETKLVVLDGYGKIFVMDINGNNNIQIAQTESFNYYSYMNVVNGKIVYSGHLSIGLDEDINNYNQINN